jgi:hypothetical protein
MQSEHEANSLSPFAPAPWEAVSKEPTMRDVMEAVNTFRNEVMIRDHVHRDEIRGLHEKFDAVLEIISGIKDQVQPLVDSLQELPFLGKALKRGTRS